MESSSRKIVASFSLAGFVLSFLSSMLAEASVSVALQRSVLVATLLGLFVFVVLFISERI